MAKLRAGVIGVGHLGRHHARLYASSPDTTLVGVMDQDGTRASAIAEKFGTQTFRGLAEFLKQVEVVSIAVPTSGHYAVARACLEAKKHVLIEKPIAVSPNEAQDLVGLAGRHGCTLQVGHSERFNTIMPLMRPHIQAPMLFECHRLGTYSERGTDVDVVLDLMIHDIDLLLSCNPGPVEAVLATGGALLSPTNDIANARILFLAERSSERGHPSSKEAEENMTCFVERKIDEVEKAFTRIICLHGCENKFRSPYKKDEKNESPSTEIKGVNLWLNKKHQFFDMPTYCGCLPLLFLSTVMPPQ